MIPVLVVLALLALRALAAAVEVTLAAGPDHHRRLPLGDETLASLARATSVVAGATCVGILTQLVWTGAGRGWIPLALALAVPVMIVIADLTPRGLAAELEPRRRPTLVALLALLGIVLAPLVLAERVLAAALGRPRSATPLAQLRRLGGWLAMRSGRGPLEVTEASLVARIARFAGKTARDVMVPHVDVCAVPDTSSVGAVIGLVRERGFSRLPVFHERLFNTTGIVASLDLLGVTDLDLPVQAVTREPFFVPESKPLPELLGTLQSEGRNLAMVVDEYGGAVGLVTVEDLIEEIVGDIEDEYDAPKELYRRIAPGVWVVSARAPVARVNERFGWNLPLGEYETLGGLVLERLGRVPKPGDGLRVGRVRLEVTRASARAVQELRVHTGSGRTS